MFDCIIKVLYNAIDCCSTHHGHNGLLYRSNGNGVSGSSSSHGGSSHYGSYNNGYNNNRDAQYNTFECGFALCDIGFMLIAIIPILFLYYSIISSILIYIRIKKYENKYIILMSSLVRIKDDNNDNNNNNNDNNTTSSSSSSYSGSGYDFRIDTNRQRAGGGRC
jgi:hypothetical protein